MTACQYKLKDQVLFMDCYTTSAETAHRLPLQQFQHKPPFVFPCCSGLNSAGSSVPHSHSHSFPQWYGEKNWRTEVAELISWDKDSWSEVGRVITQKTQGKTSDAKAVTHRWLIPAGPWKMTTLEHSPQVKNPNQHHRLLCRKLTPFQPDVVHLSKFK